MNRKFSLVLSLVCLSLPAFSGVKVTGLNLVTDGPNGHVNVSIEGRSSELPDIRVYGKTIEVVLAKAEAFNGITKTIKGALLSANVLNGKAIIKTILPYNVEADSVNLGWKNSNLEIIFPRGKAVAAVVPEAMTGRAPTTPVSLKETVTTEATKEKVVKTIAATKPVVAAVEAERVPQTETRKESVSKDALNEDYLNKLVNEEKPKQDTPSAHVDEVKTRQAAPHKNLIEEKSKSGNDFSFAGYAAKFTIFLALVLGLFYGVVQLLKKGVFNRGKLGFLNNTKMIEVLSTTYVAPKRSLMVVKAHKQIFLVANSENGLQFLSEMTDISGLIKEGEKAVTGSNFDTNLASLESTEEFMVKLKENIQESTPIKEEKGLAKLAVATDIVKFSDELKKKAKKLRPIEFN